MFAPSLKKAKRTAIIKPGYPPTSPLSCRGRVTLDTGFVGCSQWRVLTAEGRCNVCAHVCVYVRQHVRLFDSLPYMYTETMATRHCGLPVFDSKSLFLLFFFSVFRMTKRKLLQLRLQVVFLTWSFLSRIVINIYTFIFQCNKDAIMYCMCASFIY